MAEYKNSQVRREEIMDAAAELFHTKGYEETTTTDIMKRVGIAKGTLYYHFKSKEEILDAMVERMGNQLIARAMACAGRKEEPIEVRLLHTLRSLQVDPVEGGEILEIMHQPRNLLLHEKARRMILREAGPILTGLIQEGIEEGLFACAYPAQAVEMVILYVLIVFDGQRDAGEDLRQVTAEGAEGDQVGKRTIAAFISNVERLFGAKEGTFAFVWQLFSDGGEGEGLGADGMV